MISDSYSWTTEILYKVLFQSFIHTETFKRFKVMSKSYLTLFKLGKDHTMVDYSTQVWWCNYKNIKWKIRIINQYYYYYKPSLIQKLWNTQKHSMPSWMWAITVQPITFLSFKLIPYTSTTNSRNYQIQTTFFIWF